MQSVGTVTGGRYLHEVATIVLTGLLVFGEMVLMLGRTVEAYPPTMDGMYASRCTSKLDTTLQQIFRRLGASSGPTGSLRGGIATNHHHSPYSSPKRRRYVEDNDDGFLHGRRRPSSSEYYNLNLDEYDRPAPQMADVDDDWHQKRIRPNHHHHQLHQHDEDVERPIHDREDYEEDERMANGGWESGRIRVAELRVRLPAGDADSGGQSWVRVEKCHFQPSNRTLDTRLTFPDLTISGRVQIQPKFNSRGHGGVADENDASFKDARDGGGSCSMILRLRQAGIEFRTVPLVEDHSRTASVRTDSYFADPGFISVFAHGCDGLMAAAAGVYGRPKRGGRSSAAEQQNREQRGATTNGKVHDAFHFDGDILGYAVGDWGDWLEAAAPPPQDRSWPLTSGGDLGLRRPSAASAAWQQHVELANSAERDEQYTRDLEELFSKGVRGLLTTYMQRALQPAIKETLMESLGYRLSYG